MRSLLIGGAGFIGSHLAKRLLTEGHEVTIADDLSRGNITDLKHLPIRFQYANVTDRRWPVLIAGEWDWVFCLAAVVGVPNVDANPQRTLAVQTGVVQGALSPILPSRRLFFASTSEAYGHPDQIPTPETSSLSIPDITTARATYAASKIWGESMVIHSGRSYVIGRFHNVYGPRMGYDHVIPRFCDQLIRQTNPLIVHDPMAMRAFCYVEDAVEAMIQMMRLSENVVVNIGNPQEPISMRGLMMRLWPLTGRSDWSICDGYDRSLVRQRIPDIRRLQDMTAWRAIVDLDEGLRRTWEWYSHGG